MPARRCARFRRRRRRGVDKPMWAVPRSGPRSIACGDQARSAVLSLAGDDRYRFRPPGGEIAPTAPAGHPTLSSLGRLVRQRGRPQPTRPPIGALPKPLAPASLRSPLRDRCVDQEGGRRGDHDRGSQLGGVPPVPVHRDAAASDDASPTLNASASITTLRPVRRQRCVDGARLAGRSRMRSAARSSVASMRGGPPAVGLSKWSAARGRRAAGSSPDNDGVRPSIPAQASQP